MTMYTRQIMTAIQATQIVSATGFAWYGRRSREPEANTRRGFDAGQARAYLRFTLQSQLYRAFYCQGAATALALGDARQRVVGMTPFIQALSAANNGQGCWEPGWSVRAVEHGIVTVSQHDLAVRVVPEECQATDHVQLVPGAMVSLRLPKEMLGLSPGYYLAIGDTTPIPQSADSIVRFYWNVVAVGAEHLMREVTGALNEAGIAFRLKVMNSPAGYVRRDAGVVYVARSDYPAVAGQLERIYPALVEFLRPGVPAFTKPLVHGLGLAEDPGGTESFGMHRCRLLAEGIIRAHEQHTRTLEGRLICVMDRFKEVGISLDQPFVNPGSRDGYTFHARTHPRPRGSAQWIRTATGTTAYLDMATSIGERLTREAVWHAERCNWMGAEPTIEEAPRSGSIIYRALGPDLYAGTSGIAWFLADLAAVTGETKARRTALGALRQATACADALPPGDALGLYTGRMGIALAAAHVGVVLGETEPLERSARLAWRTLRSSQGKPEHDLLVGTAGTVVALLILHELLNDAALLEQARDLGNGLLGAAEKSEVGYSWKTAINPGGRNLTGVSHGAAGIGFALLALFHATHDEAYKAGAERAFDYERHWFDAQAGNWPDFRANRPGSGRKRDPLAFSVAWCHGAPGIALSRLHAWGVLGEERYKAEALIALQTTCGAVEEMLATGIGTFSLCHGLAGNADILAYGERVLGEEAPGGLNRAHAVADAGIAAYARGDSPWPSGTNFGQKTPALMLGLAGIGHFYLRLHDPSIPGVLLMLPESTINSVN